MAVSPPTGARGRKTHLLPMSASGASFVEAAAFHGFREPVLAPTVVPVHHHVPPIWQTCCQFFTLVWRRRNWQRRQAWAIASTPATRAPAPCRMQTDSAAVAPVVTMSSTSSTVLPMGRRNRTRPWTLRWRAMVDSPTESRVVARMRRAFTTSTPSRWLATAVAMRATGSPPRRRAAARRVGAGTKVSGRSTMPQPTSRSTPSPSASDSGTIRIRSAVLLGGHDRGAARAGVAAQREHRHSRVHAGVDQSRVIWFESELARAGVAPSRGRGTAAAAFERQHQVEHEASVAITTDTDFVPVLSRFAPHQSSP